jgi:hypothetical protein
MLERDCIRRDRKVYWSLGLHIGSIMALSGTDRIRATEGDFRPPASVGSRHPGSLRLPEVTRMYGPAVRRKRFCRSGGCAVLHQCIRPLVGACVLRATMDISARAISLADRPRPGHSGHQCSHAPGRPILHLVSSSRRPRRETGGGTTSLRAPCLCSSFVRAVRPFLRPGLCLFPGTAHRGRQGWPSRLGLPLAPGFQAMP